MWPHKNTRTNRRYNWRLVLHPQDFSQIVRFCNRTIPCDCTFSEMCKGIHCCKMHLPSSELSYTPSIHLQMFIDKCCMYPPAVLFQLQVGMHPVGLVCSYLVNAVPAKFVSWLKEQSHEIVRLPNRTICEKSCGCKTSLQFYLRSVLGLVVFNRAMDGAITYDCRRWSYDWKYSLRDRFWSYDYSCLIRLAVRFYEMACDVSSRLL